MKRKKRRTGPRGKDNARRINTGKAHTRSKPSREDRSVDGKNQRGKLPMNERGVSEKQKGNPESTVCKVRQNKQGER